MTKPIAVSVNIRLILMEFIISNILYIQVVSKPQVDKQPKSLLFALCFIDNSPVKSIASKTVSN